jgi:hypothetical protein
MGLLQASHLYTSICEGVYHGGQLGHGKDVTQHENWKKRARILKARIMWTGCDVHHGYWVGRDARGAALGLEWALGYVGVPVRGSNAD